MFCSLAYSQSRDQNFPTRVTSNEISGVIPARDIGDARSTSYFYTFDGTQGDIFVNVVTKNLTGDIDIFTADTVQPLSKIVVYADSPQGETGRVIYLRRPARLLLRVEGRTPNDDPATFKIKFAGSFAVMAPGDKEEAPTVDRSERDDSASIRVNSVGTIIAVPPKPKDEPKVIDADKEAVAAEAKNESPVIPSDVPVKRSRPAPEVKTVFGAEKKEKSAVDRASAKKEKPAADVTSKKEKADPVERAPERNQGLAVPAEPVTADPLASINLVIVMKDGGVIERPMSEVLRFSVDKGVLTVITKDRKTSRFSILNVEKVTIQ